MQLTYLAKLTRDRKDGGFVVTFRDVPEAITQGDTLADALSDAALQAALEARIEDGMDIPATTPAKRGEHLVPTSITTALKAAVHLTMLQQGVTKTELARRMHVDEKEARRMIDPHHQTKVPALESALSALGLRAEIAVS